MRRKKRKVGVDKLREEKKRFHHEMKSIANPSGRLVQQSTESSDLDDEKGAVWDSSESLNPLLQQIPEAAAANAVEGWDCFPQSGASTGPKSKSGDSTSKTSAAVLTNVIHLDPPLPKSSRDVTPRGAHVETSTLMTSATPSIAICSDSNVLQLPPGEVVLASRYLDQAPESVSKDSVERKTYISTRSTETNASSRRLTSKVKDILERLDAGAPLEGLLFGGAQTASATGLPEAQAYLQGIVTALTPRDTAHLKEQAARDAVDVDKLVAQYSASIETERDSIDKNGGKLIEPERCAVPSEPVDAIEVTGRKVDSATSMDQHTGLKLDNVTDQHTGLKLDNVTDQHTGRKVDNATSMDQHFASASNQCHLNVDTVPNVCDRVIDCALQTVASKQQVETLGTQKDLEIKRNRRSPKRTSPKEIVIKRRARRYNDEFLENCREKVGNLLEGNRVLQTSSKSPTRQRTSERKENSIGPVQRRTLKQGKENKAQPVDGNDMVSSSSPIVTVNNKQAAASPAEPNAWKRLEVRLALAKSASKTVTGGGSFDYDEIHKELVDLERQRVLIEQRDKLHRYLPVPGREMVVVGKVNDDLPTRKPADALKASSVKESRIKRPRTTRSPAREQEPSKLLRSSLGRMKPLLVSGAGTDIRSLMPLKHTANTSTMRQPKRTRAAMKNPEVQASFREKTPAWVKRMSDNKPKLGILELERADKFNAFGTLRRRSVRPPESIFRAGKPISWLPEHGDLTGDMPMPKDRRKVVVTAPKGKSKRNVEVPIAVGKCENVRGNIPAMPQAGSKGQERSSQSTEVSHTRNVMKSKPVELAEQGETSARGGQVDAWKSSTKLADSGGGKPGWIVVGDFCISEMETTQAGLPGVEMQPVAQSERAQQQEGPEKELLKQSLMEAFLANLVNEDRTDRRCVMEVFSEAQTEQLQTLREVIGAQQQSPRVMSPRNVLLAGPRHTSTPRGQSLIQESEGVHHIIQEPVAERHRAEHCQSAQLAERMVKWSIHSPLSLDELTEAARREVKPANVLTITRTCQTIAPQASPPRLFFDMLTSTEDFSRTAIDFQIEMPAPSARELQSPRIIKKSKPLSPTRHQEIETQTAVETLSSSPPTPSTPSSLPEHQQALVEAALAPLQIGKANVDRLVSLPRILLPRQDFDSEPGSGIATQYGVVQFDELWPQRPYSNAESSQAQHGCSGSPAHGQPSSPNHKQSGERDTLLEKDPDAMHQRYSPWKNLLHFARCLPTFARSRAGSKRNTSGKNTPPPVPGVEKKRPSVWTQSVTTGHGYSDADKLPSQSVAKNEQLEPLPSQNAEEAFGQREIISQEMVHMASTSSKPKLDSELMLSLGHRDSLPRAPLRFEKLQPSAFKQRSKLKRNEELIQQHESSSSLHFEQIQKHTEARPRLKNETELLQAFEQCELSSKPSRDVVQRTELESNAELTRGGSAAPSSHVDRLHWKPQVGDPGLLRAQFGRPRMKDPVHVLEPSGVADGGLLQARDASSWEPRHQASVPVPQPAVADEEPSCETLFYEEVEHVELKTGDQEFMGDGILHDEMFRSVEAEERNSGEHLTYEELESSTLKLDPGLIPSWPIL